MGKNNLEEFFKANQAMEMNSEVKRIARDIAHNMSLSSFVLSTDEFGVSDSLDSESLMSEEFSVFEFKTSMIAPAMPEEAVELEAIQIAYAMENEQASEEIQMSEAAAQFISDLSAKFVMAQEGSSEIELFYTEPAMLMSADAYDANPEVVAVSEDVEEDEFEQLQSSLEDQSRFTYEETIPELIELVTDVSGVRPNEIRNEYADGTALEFTNDIKPYETLGDLLLGDGN